jgi:hypothetical protein
MTGTAELRLQYIKDYLANDGFPVSEREGARSDSAVIVMHLDHGAQILRIEADLLERYEPDEMNNTLSSAVKDLGTGADVSIRSFGLR